MFDLQELCERLHEVMEAVLENLPEDVEELAEEDVYQSTESHSSTLPPPEQGHGASAQAAPRVTDSRPHRPSCEKCKPSCTGASIDATINNR